MIKRYDLLVLGGGSAGTAVASEAVKLGISKVGMINDGELGGLCILRGCMPTKAMLLSSELLHHFRHSLEIGIEIEKYSYDFATIMKRKKELVDRFKRAKVGGIQKGGYEVIHGRASFASRDTVEVNGEILKAKAFVIATGSKVKTPPILGIEKIHFWTSDDLMELTEEPSSILILGAGAIALEFATFFSALHTKVTLINRSPILRRGQNPELSSHYKKMLEDLGITVYAPAKILELSESDTGKTIRIEHLGETLSISAHSLLVATGREANLDGLALNLGEVAFQKNQIQINSSLQSTNPKVFVAGDATNEGLILHLSTGQGRHVAHNIKSFLQNETLREWQDKIPLSVIFSDHPYGEVGLVEEEAKEKGLLVVSAKKNWANQGRGIVMNTRPGQGFIKMVAEKGTGRMLGAQILGPRADDMIHVISTVMYYQGTAKDIVNMPWYHPTLSEAFLELARELDLKAKE